jgi:phage/plasmid-like protein (TIGR03299 family)
VTDPNYDPTVNDWGSKYDVAEGPNHGIDESVTGGAFASIRDKAWHNLGYVSDVQISASELLKKGWCDYPIYKRPAVSLIEDPDDPSNVVTVTNDRRWHLLRDNPETEAPEILGDVGKDYPVWTPHDILVGFGDAILDLGHPTVSTCGALDGGRQAFMSFKLPQDVVVGGLTDETINLWLVVHTSFDQSAPTSATVTPVRAVCRNTIRAGVDKAVTRFQLKKTKNADLHAKQAQTALGLVVPHRQQLQVVADKLVNMTITNNRFHEIITNEFGPGEDPSKAALKVWDEKAAKLDTLFSLSDTQANIRHTGWGALQAVGEYADWMTKVGGKNAKRDADAVRLERSFILQEKSVSTPKDVMRRALLALAGA